MSDEEMSESEGEDDGQETALIPKSWFQGKDIEIGSKCKLKVVGIFDEEIEVEYVKSKKKEKDSDGDDDDSEDSKPKRDSMDGAMREMDMMASPPPSMGGY